MSENASVPRIQVRHQRDAIVDRALDRVVGRLAAEVEAGEAEHEQRVVETRGAGLVEPDAEDAGPIGVR